MKSLKKLIKMNNKMTRNLTMFFIFSVIPFVSANASSIIGNVDGITSNQSVYGWACQMGLASSINVGIYAGNPAQGGVLIGQYTANNPSEPAVASSCQSTGSTYRFSIPLSAAVMSSYAGKSIYVTGISAGLSTTINQSGKFNIPSAPGIIGNIDGIVSYNNGYALSGWACLQELSSSINVSLYAGVPSNGGTLIGSYAANNPSLPAIASNCESTGNAYNFLIPLDQSTLQTYGGQSVYMMGIANGVSKVINGSGQVNLPPKTPLLWFGPSIKYTSGTDLMNMFVEPNTQWATAAAHLNIFMITGGYLTYLTDAQLKTIFTFLNQNGITLALEHGMVNYLPLCQGSLNPRCGQIESQGGQYLAQDLTRIKNDGGNLKYLESDEALSFGHIAPTSQQPGAIQVPIPALAANVATQIQTALSIFPGLQIGLSEPVVPNEPSDYLSELQQFDSTVQADVKSLIGSANMPAGWFFNADVLWPSYSSVQTQLSQIETLMHSMNVKFGVFYDGNLTESTNQQWGLDTEMNFSMYESNPLNVPDNAVFLSWSALPTNNLPETVPGTWTNTFDRYLAQQSVFNVNQTGNGFNGLLTTTQGAVVANAPIAASAIDDGILRIQTNPSIQGTVPAGAVTAVIGLRVGIELAGSGPINVLLGTAKYTDIALMQTFTQTISWAPLVYAAGTCSTGNYNYPCAFNGNSFPVTAGDSFTFTVPMEASYTSNNNGYVTVIFLGSNGLEISRQYIYFKAGQQLIWSGDTDSNGNFTITMPSGQTVPSTVQFVYNGDGSHRYTQFLKTGTN